MQQSLYSSRAKLTQVVTNLLNQQVKLSVDVERLMEEDTENANGAWLSAGRRPPDMPVYLQREKTWKRRCGDLLEDLTQGIIDKDEFRYIKAKYDREYEQFAG